MAVKNIKTSNPIFPIPISSVSPVYSITVEKDDGTIDTITSDIVSCNIVKSGTGQIGSFDIELLNIDGAYVDSYNGGEYVNIYMDYVDGTTLFFRGRIGKYFYQLNNSSGFIVRISGRDYPEIADKHDTKSFIISNITDSFVGINGTQDSNGNYPDGILYNTGLKWDPANTSLPATTFTFYYTDESKLKMIGDICEYTECDSYIYYNTSDSTWYIRVFESGTVTNLNESVTYGVNLISLDSLGYDYDSDEFNRIRMYGEEDNNIVYLKTENDTTSQGNLWIKDMVLSDSNIITQNQLDDKISFQIANNLAQQSGSLSCFPLLTLQPGEQIPIIIPYCKANGLFKINQINTTINSSGITSTLSIEKTEDSIAKIFKERIDAEKALQPQQNLNDMDYAYVVDFSTTDDGTHSNTEVSDGKLKLTSTLSSGTWISQTINTSDDFGSVELRLKANTDIDDSLYYISGDNGNSYNLVDFGTLYDFGILGTQLKIKIVLTPTADNPNPKIEKICLLYK